MLYSRCGRVTSFSSCNWEAALADTMRHSNGPLGGKSGPHFCVRHGASDHAAAPPPTKGVELRSVQVEANDPRARSS